MNDSLTWFWLSLFFALWTSISISIVKKLTTRMDWLLLVLVEDIFIMPFMLILIFLLGGIPSLSPKFYLLMFASSILDTITAVASTLAISISPISLISPISSFNPIFTTIIAAFTIHEVPSLTKLLGIIIVVLGTYLLNVFDIGKGLFTPFKKLFSSRGVQLFLLANFLWGITPIFQKQAIFQTTPVMPLFPSFFGSVLIAIFLAPIVILRTKNPLSQIKNNWKLLLFLAPFSALAQWAAFTAFSLQNLGLVTSVFKLSILFTIAWGFLFFKEERIKERLLGASVMIVGTLLLLR